MTLLIFWNAPSADSRAVLLDLNRFCKRINCKKINIIGIVRDPADKAARFVKRKAIRFCQFYDPDEITRENYDIDTDEEPIFWLVDDGGKVRLRLNGYTEANLHKIKKIYRQCLSV
ncbi:MAG: peroxiredoxin family protein [Saprospiraceae bacterium]